MEDEAISAADLSGRDLFAHLRSTRESEVDTSRCGGDDVVLLLSDASHVSPGCASSLLSLASSSPAWS